MKWALEKKKKKKKRNEKYSVLSNKCASCCFFYVSQLLVLSRVGFLFYLLHSVVIELVWNDLTCRAVRSHACLSRSLIASVLKSDNFVSLLQLVL